MLQPKWPNITPIEIEDAENNLTPLSRQLFAELYESLRTLGEVITKHKINVLTGYVSKMPLAAGFWKYQVLVRLPHQSWHPI